MTKTVRWLLVFIGVLLFAVGLLVGQQTRPSKFQKYLRPAEMSSMDLALLRVNIEIVRDNLTFEVPRVHYDSSCTCFVAHSTVTSDLTKQPLDEVRGRLMALAAIARRDLALEFPELSKSGTVPDRDFRMTFYELNLQKPDASHDLAEYVDGKIVFK